MSDRIIETAMAALAEGGLDSLTMQGLAGELDLAVGALYRYFPGKDAIIVSVQRRIIETILEELGAALKKAQTQLSGLDRRQASLLRVWVMVRVYESMARRRPTEFGLLSMTLGDPRQLVQDEDAGQVVPSLLELFQLVGGLFADAEETGALKAGDSSRRTVVLWTSVHGALQLRKLERFAVGGLQASAVVDEAVSTLLLGWGANAADTLAMQSRAQQLIGMSP